MSDYVGVANILLLFTSLNNFVPLVTTPYDANTFVGKWYVIATVHPTTQLKLDCIQRYVSKDENDVFTVVTNVVCRACSYKTFTGRITNSTIYDIVIDGIPSSWNISISNYQCDDEVVLYDTSQQVYYLMSRHNTLSTQFSKLCLDFYEREWKVFHVSHERCE